MIKTFTGFSDRGLDGAVIDAYREMDSCIQAARDNFKIRVMSTTSNVVLPPNNDWNAEYWFTITIQID